MKFHRIRLRDYRGIAHCLIEPRESGVTVIEGDNEVGKSSIAEALWLIFEQNDDSTSQLVRALRPADRDAAPEIEVEVSTGPYRFTYFKRFARGSRTELKITQPKRETLVGREAHNRARQILEETIDIALWKALRSQQGEQASLDPPAAGQHASVLGALKVDALLGGEREQMLFEAARLEYERYFTGSGRERAAGDADNAPKLRTAENDAAADVDRIEARMAAMEERALRAAELEESVGRLAAQADAASVTRDALAQTHGERQAAEREVERIQSELRAGEARCRELASEQETRNRFVASLEPRSAELAKEEAALATLPPLLAAAEAEFTAATERAAVAKSELDEAEAAPRQVDQLLQLSGRQLQADQMAERLERLERLEPAMAELADWLKVCRVDQRVLNELEELDRSLAELEMRREAEGASVEVNSLDGATITVNGHETVLSPGQTVRGKVVGERTIVLPGGITITIRAGSASRELEAKIATARKALASKLASAGTESLAAARALNDERIAAEERRRGHAQQISADLRDLRSATELKAKLDREREAIAAILRDAGLDAAPSVEAAKARREAAAAALAGREAEHGQRNALLQQAASALARLKEDERLVQARIETMRAEVSRAEQELADFRARQSDADLATALTAARSELESGAAAAEAAARLVASLPDVSTPLAAAEADLRSATEQASRASLELAGIRGVLEDAGAAGLHGQLVEAQQRLTEATETLASFTRRAAAARMLYETLKRCRDEARESYAGPLKAHLESLGRRVYNDSFGIELSEDLRVIRRSLDGITLDLAQVSVGAREQLAVLTRLACAALVSEDGGAPLVLDDILGWADATRLEALGPVLAEAAEGLQVLLLTCYPARFASVRPARVVSLPSCESFERTGDVSPSVEVESHAARTPPRRLAAPLPAAPARAPQGAFDLFDIAPAGRRDN